MLNWRLKAFNRLKVLKEPNWQKPKYPKINYQDLYYYSAPKSMKDKPKSLDEIDFKVFSQNNEDCILEFLIKTLKLKDIYDALNIKSHNNIKKTKIFDIKDLNSASNKDITFLHSIIFSRLYIY